jgi:exodeoxyribonuclease V beta subunit
MLLRLIDNLLATPLGAGEQSFSLGSIGLADRLDETGFSLPVSRLTSAGLKSTLGTLLPEELELWEKLRFGAVDGYLRGYIDCIVRAGGKFYLIDWKSNWLGQRSCDYRKETIQASILTHGYRLQYHLYAVALTRYLRNRLPSFLPERDFGGCIYVYLRGFRETPNPQSFFYDNPSPEKLRELETALHR